MKTVSRRLLLREIDSLGGTFDVKPLWIVFAFPACGVRAAIVIEVLTSDARRSYLGSGMTSRKCPMGRARGNPSARLACAPFPS